MDRLLLPLLEEASSAPICSRMFAELLEMTWLFQLPGALPTSSGELGFAADVARARLVETYEQSMGVLGSEPRGCSPRRTPPGLDELELAS